MGAYAAVAPTGAVLAAHGQATASLTPAEAARWGALRATGDRDDFVAARALTRALLDRVCGPRSPTWEWTQVCVRCGGPHGRPVLKNVANVAISWAYAHGWVAAAVAPVAVGIDVEPAHPGPPPVPGWASVPVAQQWLGWTRAEALVKHGSGLVIDGTAQPVDLDAALALPLTGPAAHGTPIMMGRGRLSQPITDIVGTDWVASVATAATVEVVTGLP